MLHVQNKMVNENEIQNKTTELKSQSFHDHMISVSSAGKIEFFAADSTGYSSASSCKNQRCNYSTQPKSSSSALRFQITRIDTPSLACFQRPCRNSPIHADSATAIPCFAQEAAMTVSHPTRQSHALGACRPLLWSVLNFFIKK